MEYNLLEEQLQKTLADLEKREKQLAHAEMEVRDPGAAWGRGSGKGAGLWLKGAGPASVMTTEGQR